MIAAVLAAATVAAAATPTPAPVAECIWGKLPAYKEKVLAAPDFATFDRMRRAYPDGEAEKAFAACVPEGGADAAAETAFTYYEASLWAGRRLAVKWPAATLAAIDKIPEENLRYFWLQPEPGKIDAAYQLRRSEVWARVYEPFGRKAPAATRDDLDMYIIGRVGWRLGELDYSQGLQRR